MRKVNLVFSGSGTRWPIFVGAYKRIEEELKHRNMGVSQALGTSGGAILAGCIGSGLSAQQIEELCLAIMPKIYELADPSIFNLFRKLGLLAGKKIESEIQKFLPLRLSECKVPVHIVTTNFDSEQEVVFNKIKDPDLTLAKAIRMSISVPLIFAPALYKGTLYMDGGISSNFKIDAFGDTPNTIGVSLVGKSDGVIQPRPKGFFALLGVFTRVLNMLINSKTRNDVQEASSANSIAIRTSYPSFNLTTSTETIKDMIRQGYEQTDVWFKNNPKTLEKIKG